MLINFNKFHGAGNDFIMIDSRDYNDDVFTTEKVQFLCNRNFGIGADGLILLLEDENQFYRMKYFNSDGKEGTMCGNGGRCFASFVKKLGLIGNSFEFIGIDGMHQAVFKNEKLISLKMIDVKNIRQLDDGYLLDTGSKHFVMFYKEIHDIDVKKVGRKYRYQERFDSDGSNINFVRLIDDDKIEIRTYERGVEDETLACGTGAVASAISAYIHTETAKKSFEVKVAGGTLHVSFTPQNDGSYKDVWLTGPAEYVFEGTVDII